MEREFTTSVYVLENAKVLLIFHPKLKKWLPPGGHVEEGETPPEAAVREVLEETGYEVSLTSDEHLWINRWNAKSFKRPYMCLLEEIPEHKGVPAHQHIDFIYLSRPIGEPISPPGHEMRWFSWEEIDALPGDVEIFEETKETLKKLIGVASV